MVLRMPQSRSLALDDDLNAVARVLVPFLLTAAILSDALMPAPEPLSNLLATLSLTVFAVAVLSASRTRLEPRSRRPVFAGFLVLTATAALGIRIVDGSAEVLVFALFVFGIDVVLRRAGGSHTDLPTMQLTLLLYTIFLLLHGYVAYVHHTFAVFARLLSSAASVFVRGEISVGEGFLGMHLIVLLLLHVLSITVFAARGRSLWRSASAAVVILFGALSYAIVWGWLSEVVAVNRFVALIQPFAAPYDYRLLLFGLLLVPGVLYRSAMPPREAAERTWRRALAFDGAGAALLAAGVLLLAVQLPTGELGRRVVVVDSGGNIAEDVPVFGRYGLTQVGQFGLLPTYLEAAGYEVGIVEQVSADTLEHADILVVINLRSDFSDEVRDAVWEFIEGGGGLLVAGDHTGREEIRDPSNHLLEPVGISLNFDSAIPLRTGWPNGFEVKPHPAVADVTEQELQILIGASLDVPPPARTVIVGRAGFSDAGDVDNVEQGYLGDMAYNRGEKLGDLPLVAEVTYGRGKVLAFGDTTMLQNLAMAHSYRFVDGVFAWLASPVDARLPTARVLGGAILLVLGAVLVTVRAGLSAHVSAIPAGGLAVALVLSGVSAQPLTSDWEDRAFDARYAVVDTSHFELGRFDTSGDALYGLLANLLRSGYVPFVMSDFSPAMVRGADLLVIPAPMKPFGRAEIEVIDTFVIDGGLLILTTGSERPAGSHGLLRHMGYELGGVPLGRGVSRWERQNVRFWSAWPLKYDSRDNPEVIAEVWGHPVMLYRRQGMGGSLVVADAAFFFDKNLEGVNAYNLDNIDFLRTFLATYGGGGERDP